MKLVVGIDVGIKNLAFCALSAGDDGRFEIKEWANEHLTEGNYLPLKNVEYIRAFVQRHAALLAEADLVVVERQMRVNMRIIEAVLHALFFAKCVVVQARTVKAYYGLCMRNYRLNKQAAVEHVTKLLQQADSSWLPCFEVMRKKDDLADAFLMAHYFSSNGQCSTGSGAQRWSPPPPAKTIICTTATCPRTTTPLSATSHTSITGRGSPISIGSSTSISAI